MHCHFSSAYRTFGHKFGWDQTVFSGSIHLFKQFFCIIHLWMTAALTLNFSIIALCCKNPVCRKSCFVKLMIDIRGKYKILLILHHGKQFLIQRQCRWIKPVDQRMFGPVAPSCFLRRKWIKTRCIHIGHILTAIFSDEFRKVFPKPLSTIRKSCRRGSSRACTYNHCIGIL